MSDPLSVAAGVAGLITAAAQISGILIKFTKKFKDAPSEAFMVLNEVTHTGQIISQLQSFMFDTRAASRSQISLLHVESVVTIITGCVATFSELQGLINGLWTDEMTVVDRLKWAKNESSISALGSRLQTHKASLSLMLDILNGNTMQEIKGTVDRLDSRVANDYHDILKRVQALEVQQSSQPDQISVLEKSTESRFSVLTVQEGLPEDNELSKGPSRQSFNYGFERALSGSRVYKNIKFPGSTSSLLTTDQPASRWSTFSGFTIAEAMSQMSVLNLAITTSEVFFSHQYTLLPPTRRLSAQLPRGNARKKLGFIRPIRPVGPRPPMEWEPKVDPSVVGEFCRRTGASVENTCPEVLFVALKIYAKLSIGSELRLRKSLFYALSILDGDLEHYFGFEERPLAVFKQIVLCGRRPNFMIRKRESPALGFDEENTIENVGRLKEGWWVSQEVFVEIMSNDPSLLQSPAMIYKFPKGSST